MNHAGRFGVSPAGASPAAVHRAQTLPALRAAVWRLCRGRYGAGRAADRRRRRSDGRSDSCRLQWPRGEGVDDIDAHRTHLITDQRNWSSSGLHGGGRWVCEGSVDREPVVGGGSIMTEALQMIRAEINVRDFQRWMGCAGCRTRTTGCTAC